MRGEIVIVTGASSGIGRACAIEFAANGAKVVLAARRVDRLQELEDLLIQKYNTEVLSVVTDVSKEDDCKNLVTKTVDKFGGIDILLNNAGVSQRSLFVDMDLSVMERVMSVNFWGSVYCTRFALPYLIKSKGSVIAMSSISGFTALPARTAYCASKYAIHGMMEALRIENLKTGLHVMVVAPGFTSSEIRKNALAADGTAQGETPRDESKMQTPEKVAQLVVKGVRRRKRHLIISRLGWWTINVNKFIPDFVDKRIYAHILKETDSPIK